MIATRARPQIMLFQFGDFFSEQDQLLERQSRPGGFFSSCTPFRQRVHGAPHLSVYTLLSTTKTYPGARKASISEFGRQIAGDNGAQHGAKIRGAFGAETAIKSRLRAFPSFAPREQALFTGFGEM